MGGKTFGQQVGRVRDDCPQRQRAKWMLRPDDDLCLHDEEQARQQAPNRQPRHAPRRKLESKTFVIGRGRRRRAQAARAAEARVAFWYRLTSLSEII